MVIFQMSQLEQHSVYDEKLAGIYFGGWTSLLDNEII